MTDIEKMAREAADKHLKCQIEGPEVSGVFDFAEAIAQAVARRCAEICLELGSKSLAAYVIPSDQLSGEMLQKVAHLGNSECAAAIRAEFEIREEP